MARYGSKAQEKVEESMHEFKRGQLRSSSGQKVTNPKQAIAIGLSEARADGGKVPAKKAPARKAAAKKASGERAAAKKGSGEKAGGREAASGKPAAKKSSGGRPTAKKAASH
jgi:hypothetical protein